MLVSVLGAVCEQPADPAGAVKAAGSRAAGSAEGNAGQSPRPGEGNGEGGGQRVGLSLGPGGVIVLEISKHCFIISPIGSEL